MAEEYSIFVYTKIDSEKPDHRFYAKGGREVVGLMKTIMDNFKPVHVDIMHNKSYD